MSNILVDQKMQAQNTVHQGLEEKKKNSENYHEKIHNEMNKNVWDKKRLTHNIQDSTLDLESITILD